MVCCSCDLKAVIRTSWNNQNHDRRFYGCPTLIILGLLRSRSELEEIIAMVEEERLRKMRAFDKKHGIGREKKACTNSQDMLQRNHPVDLLNMGLAGYYGRVMPIPSVGINQVTASVALNT
ncbi:hypothetical protein Tco_0589002 [Tanacetum coccineum]